MAKSDFKRPDAPSERKRGIQGRKRMGDRTKEEKNQTREVEVERIRSLRAECTNEMITGRSIRLITFSSFPSALDALDAPVM